MSELIVTTIIIILGGICLLLPLWILRFFAWLLAIFFQYIVRFRRRILNKNLKIVFADTMSPQEKKKFIKKVYYHLSLIIFESLRAIFMSKKRLRKYIHLDSSIENILLDSQKGVVFAAHLGNWEYALIGLEVYNIKNFIVLKKVKRINGNFLIKYLRKRKKGESFIKGDDKKSLWTISKQLKKCFIMLIMDQKSLGKEGAEVNIFGKLTSIYKFPYVLASKNNSPTYFIYSFRNEDMTTHTMYMEKIKLKENKENNQEIASENRKIVARVFEKNLKKQPEQWLWLHDFWSQK